MSVNRTNPARRHWCNVCMGLRDQGHAHEGAGTGRPAHRHDEHDQAWWATCDHPPITTVDPWHLAAWA